MTDYARGICPGSGVDFFDEEDEWPAVSLCRCCPIMEACGEDGIREERERLDDELYGVRGGLTPDDRRRRRATVV